MPILVLGIVNAGNCAGIFLCGAVIAFAVKYDCIIAFFKKLCKNIAGRIATMFFCVAMTLGIGISLVASGLIWASFHNPPDCETTVVVLGCKVNPDGPSLMLSQRIDAAYEFLVQKPDTVCIVSGGKGHDEPISEARCMYDELVKRGIQKERIYIENSSMSTEENLRYSLEIIEKENLCREITIITNNFHQKRATMHGQKLGIKCHNISADTPLFLFPTYFLREVGGVVLQMITGN